MLQRNRNNNMGTLHLFAALLVMVGHHCALLYIQTPTIFGVLIQRVAVCMIFLISGYLITKSLWERGGKLEYFGRRLIRIYPELIVCLGFSVLIIGPLFSQLPVSEYFQNPQVLTYFLHNILLFPDYSLPGVFWENPYVGAVNGSLWTIPVEVVLYVLIWVIYIIPRTLKGKKMLYTIISIGMILAFFVRIAVFPDSRIVIYGTNWIDALNIMPYFMLGGLIYLFDLKKYVNVQQSAILLFLASGVAFDKTIYREIICMLILSWFVMSLMLDEKQELKLKWLHSECAYGMYLYGFVIQQCVIQKLYVETTRPWNQYVILSVSIAMTYALAFLSHKFVYKPINNGMNKIIARTGKA